MGYARKLLGCFWQGRPWSFGLLVVLLLGAVLRLLWAQDIEYKGDEAWTFLRTQGVAGTEPCPWVGMPTSAGFRNPGMSLWVFLVLGKLTAAHDPVALARAVQFLNVAALACLVLFILRVVPRPEREAWLWAAALAALNPLGVLAQRKIWPPSVLPLCTLGMLTGWWYRQRLWGAFAWGLVGACLGQIHMAGFFFAAGFAAWALLLDRAGVRWRGWLAGSALGALPLLPWLLVVVGQGADGHSAPRWAHLFEGKFWIRWVTEPLGLSLEYTLERDFADFLGSPQLAGRPTFAVGLLHLLLAAAGGAVFLLAAWRCWRGREGLQGLWAGRGSPTGFTLSAALWGFGLLLTVSAMPIPRHYLWVAYPLGFVWLARLALGRPGQQTGARLGRGLLLTLCLAQGLITASFLGYIHANQRQIDGDYGMPYGAQQRLQASAAKKQFLAGVSR
jgi:hypothetical protein